MHTVAGLLELDRPQEAATYLQQIAGDAAGMAEELKDQIGNATIVALLLGKVTVARERGVQLTISSSAPINDAAVDGRLVVTVLGNLLDNAIDAVAGTAAAAITVQLTVEERSFLVRVTDSGPGLSAAERGSVFLDGYSTKPARDGVHRGLGLALVHRLVTQAGGGVQISADRPTTFEVRLPTREQPRR